MSEPKNVDTKKTDDAGSAALDAAIKKYDVLQGKYNAEVPRLSKDLKAANDAIAAKDAELEALKSQINAATKATGDRQYQEVFRSLEADLGVNVVKNLSGVIDARISDMTGAYEEEVKSLKSTIDAMKKQAADAGNTEFMGRLDSRVKGWRAVNGDAQFIDWLDSFKDESTGLGMREILNAHYQNRDLEGVAKVFERFSGANSTNGSGSINGLSISGNLGRTADVVYAGEAGVDLSKAIFTLPQIKTFYADVAAGKWEAQPKERAEWEAAIADAMASNRVR